METQFINMPRAAEILKTTRYTVRRLIKEGDIEGHQLRGGRGQWRVSLESLKAYLDKVRESCGSSPVHSQTTTEKSISRVLQGDFLTTGEAGRLLDVAECTILWLIRRGKFKAYQNGRGCTWRIDRESFELWQKAQAVQVVMETRDRSLWVTTTQAADMLKSSCSTVYKLIQDGLLVSNQRSSRAWKWVLRSSVEELIQSWVSQAKTRCEPVAIGVTKR